MTNSFSFFLSEKYFICPCILNDTFAGQNSIALGYRSLHFMTLNISCWFLLAYKLSFEKSTDSPMGTPLQVTNCFSLAAFKVLFLFLTFGILIICLPVGLFASMLFGTLCASWTYMSISSSIFSSSIQNSACPLVTFKIFF